MCPVVAHIVAVGPGEGNHCPAAACLNRVDVRVVISSRLTPVHRKLENLTGLFGAVSGRWGSPKPRERASSAPFHVWMDQRDQWLNLATRKRLVGGAYRVGTHVKHRSFVLLQDARSPGFGVYGVRG